MAHMYIQHINTAIHILLFTLLPFSWAGWLSFTSSVRYSWSPSSLSGPHSQTHQHRPHHMLGQGHTLILPLQRPLMLSPSAPYGFHALDFHTSSWIETHNHTSSVRLDSSLCTLQHQPHHHHSLSSSIQQHSRMLSLAVKSDSQGLLFLSSMVCPSSLVPSFLPFLSTRTHQCVPSRSSFWHSPNPSSPISCHS
jgi:hypothetical protein